MSKNLVIGFPRIGEKRELKFALEKYWSNECDFSVVEEVAKELKAKSWQRQKISGIKHISSNDFSYYDQMLDTITMVGAIPQRFQNIEDEIKRYFAMARGYEDGVAMSMSKWFGTNYHYIIPELNAHQQFSLNAKKIINEYKEALALGIETKINLISPITFLALAKCVDGSDTYLLLDKLTDVYVELLKEIGTLNDEIIVQIEDPIFVRDVTPEILSLIEPCYTKLAKASSKIKLLVSTYFEHSNEATKILAKLPIWGVGLDLVSGAKNIDALQTIAKSDKILVAGVIDGRNIWKNDLTRTLNLLHSVAKIISKERIIPATSCSLLHVPYSLGFETDMDEEIKNSLSFAYEKLEELTLLSRLFFNQKEVGDDTLLEKNRNDIATLITSEKIHNPLVAKKVAEIKKYEREETFETRIVKQKEDIGYPLLPTTTIGSFPQTKEIRDARKNLKQNLISQEQYDAIIKDYIQDVIAMQEDIGLDVLVHGEPERNDMVEYFGENLEGFAFSQNGWVQSYGARCVKPPILYGDVSMKKYITVDWITYAQNLTSKPVKGMLTGPVTIINWSFVREDLPKSTIATQIALCLSDEIDELQKRGIKIIQVDEAAFKEGYPLRKINIEAYERWAIDSFKLSVSSAEPKTQIHTHMCYSQFDDIIDAIEAMDADVISIELAKGGNALLQIFKEVHYSKEIGLGVYDIHSPRIPSVNEFKEQIAQMLEILPKEKVWINPDCGLKTRKFEEVIPALENMIEATKSFR
ncbi:MAG: 5-methyltetrahydropteroyltriglutamate--homocysteine S-methyltransferase [Campylobacterales bacterium]|nr:5-methyltetrahydropteroyltriglutamate--homocysteine S-methyltransferase [Campylobacterales bacterium]